MKTPSDEFKNVLDCETRQISVAETVALEWRTSHEIGECTSGNMVNAILESSYTHLEPDRRAVPKCT